jgi:hypothetical protein
MKVPITPPTKRPPKIVSKEKMWPENRVVIMAIAIPIIPYLLPA